MNNHHAHHQHPADAREARVARRERLRLLCEADRTRLRLVWRLPARLAKHQHDGHDHRHGWMAPLLTGPVLGAMLPFVPGKIGRWSRRLRAGIGLFRTVARGAF
jgi:hypothetical protein